MTYITENKIGPVSYLQLIAIIGGALGIIGLFLVWVDIGFSFFNPLTMSMEPYTMKATAINVIEGSSDIPDDWHIYCPVLGGIFAALGAIIAVLAIVKPGCIKYGSFAMIAFSVIGIVCCVLFYTWTFDVTFDATAFGMGIIDLGIDEHVSDDIGIGFYVTVIGGVLVLVAGLIDAIVALKGKC